MNSNSGVKIMFNLFGRTERLKALRTRIDDLEADFAVLKRKLQDLDLNLEEAKKKKRIAKDQEDEEGKIILSKEEADELKAFLKANGLSLPQN